MLDTDVGRGPYLSSFHFYIALFSNVPQSVWGVGTLKFGGPVQPNSPGVTQGGIKGFIPPKLLTNNVLNLARIVTTVSSILCLLIHTT